jgi:tRNA(His) 5'-end guanylyltransferase
MKFDELETKLRAFEKARDPSALPGLFLVARIDGRSFTRFTGEVMAFGKPYDERFRDCMVATVHHLMQCGFRVEYGYTQSDEISLFFHLGEDAFGRNIRKWTSILAGEASGAFSIAVGRAAAFDCRIIELPTLDLVVDYARWRHEDAHRNALNGWSYWTLRGDGLGVKEATDRLEKSSVAEKNELLFQHGINFNNLPKWQRRGIGVVWEEYETEGVDPRSGSQVTAVRRRLASLLELEMGDDYAAFVRGLLTAPT